MHALGRAESAQSSTRYPHFFNTSWSFYEQEARATGIKKIEFHARKTAVKFYQKLGYHLEGEEFLEVGIPHFKMEKNL